MGPVLFNAVNILTLNCMYIHLNVSVIFEQHCTSLQQRIHFQSSAEQNKYINHSEMSRVLNLLSLHQENGLSGQGVWAEGHLAVVHFHLYTQ